MFFHNKLLINLSISVSRSHYFSLVDYKIIKNYWKTIKSIIIDELTLAYHPIKQSDQI